MLQVELDTSVGNLGVETTHYRGHTPEEWAQMAANRIVGISNTAPEPITCTRQLQVIFVQ